MHLRRESGCAMGKPRVMIIGLDGAEPSLMFGPFAPLMPNLTALRNRGAWARLRSTTPPITVPAWVSMTTGADPGMLGLYGLRILDRSRYRLRLVSPDDIRIPRLWDRLSAAGLHSIVLGVPPTYPPHAIHGEMVSCFLTPSRDSDWCSPALLKDELVRAGGPFIPDIDRFREISEEKFLDRLFDMTAQRFAYARHLLDTRPGWDFFMMVDMGLDRIHHRLWRRFDPSHPRHDPDSAITKRLKRYLALLDENAGTLMERADRRTTVLVVSDHGAMQRQGSVFINEWLKTQGYLRLRSEPENPLPLEACDVDWPKTRAWSTGGYYARIFLNVQGRDPEGIIPFAHLEEEKAKLAALLSLMRPEDGTILENRVLDPRAIYSAICGHPPDLLVHLGNLGWRAEGLLGVKEVFAIADHGNEEGGANHGQDGIVIQGGDGIGSRGDRGTADILAIAPTVLDCLGLPRPRSMIGTRLEW